MADNNASCMQMLILPRSTQEIVTRHCSLVDVHASCEHSLTYQVEAEYPKGQSAKQREGIIQSGEHGVQEGRDRGVHEDVQQDLQQPADAEYNSHKTKGALQVECHDCDGPGVLWICALQHAWCVTRTTGDCWL